jgi:hypothetical protein
VTSTDRVSAAPRGDELMITPDGCGSLGVSSAKLFGIEESFCQPVQLSEFEANSGTCIARLQRCLRYACNSVRVLAGETKAKLKGIN